MTRTKGSRNKIKDITTNRPLTRSVTRNTSQSNSNNTDKRIPLTTINTPQPKTNNPKTQPSALQSNI